MQWENEGAIPDDIYGQSLMLYNYVIDHVR